MERHISGGVLGNVDSVSESSQEDVVLGGIVVQDGARSFAWLGEFPGHLELLEVRGGFIDAGQSGRSSPDPVDQIVAGQIQGSWRRRGNISRFRCRHQTVNTMPSGEEGLGVETIIVSFKVV